MAIDIYDEVDEQQTANRSDEPFFKLPYDSTEKSAEDKVHRWLIGEKNYLLKVNRHRFTLIKKNLALNKGIQYQDQELRSDNRDSVNDKKRSVQKIVINKLREANRSRASKLLKYKPNVAILPTNDELGDKVAADMTKNLLDHIWYTERFDGDILPELVNIKGPMQEAYLKIGWNPNKGDIHEEYKKELEAAKEKGSEKIELMGPDGKPEKDEQGNPIMVDKPVLNGDVEYKVVLCTDMLIDRHPSRQYRNARFSFEREVMTVEEARIKWPKAADKIQGDKDLQLYDYDQMQTYTDKNCVEIWHFYHRRTEYFDKGRYVVFTSKGILDSQDFPYSHRELPYVRWVDLENPGELHATSFFEDVKGAFGAFNNLNNMILRNEIMVGSPKWMMPAGAADIRELGNAITVVQFKGPTPPQLVQANPTGAGAYNLRESLKEEGMQLADVSRTGNGNPPQGVTAAVALQYLSELEQERWNSTVLKHNEAVLMTAIMTLAVCGDYYDPTDKRMIRIQGNDGEWMSQFFDASNLSKDYDIRIQGSSALPESKAARTETLLFLAEKFPQSVDQEQVLDMFDLAQNKKFVKEGTVSLRAAEAENEMFMSGKPVAPPEEYEDQIVHWKTHVKQIREWSFKNRATKEVKKGLVDHITAHEMLLTEQAAKNPALAQVIMGLPGFPMFYEAQPVIEAEPALPGEEMAGAMPTPYNAPVDGGQPIVDVPGEPVIPADGLPNQEALPPVDQQLGLEQQPTDLSGSV